MAAAGAAPASTRHVCLGGRGVGTAVAGPLGWRWRAAEPALADAVAQRDVRVREEVRLPAVTRLFAALVACAAGAACGVVAPPPSNPGADIHLLPDATLIQGAVPGNSTLSGMLRGHGLAADAVEAAHCRRAHRLRPAAAAVAAAVRARAHARRRAAAVRVRDRRGVVPARLRAAAVADPLQAAVLPIPRRSSTPRRPGASTSDTPSLFHSMDAAGEAGRSGGGAGGHLLGRDRFQHRTAAGRPLRAWRSSDSPRGPARTYGVVTAARVRATTAGVLRAIRFTPPGGKPGYYDEQGRSLRRFFLRSPLKFEPRITSGSRCAGCTRCCTRRGRIAASTTARRAGRTGRRRAAGTVVWR